MVYEIKMTYLSNQTKQLDFRWKPGSRFNRFPFDFKMRHTNSIYQWVFSPLKYLSFIYLHFYLEGVCVCGE